MQQHLLKLGARALSMAAISVGVVTLLAACGGGDSPANRGQQGGPSTHSTANLEVKLAEIAPAELQPQEAAGLVFVKEEEKLAFDVYRALFERWGVKAFDNISASEQTHMDAVSLLLVRYALPDPALPVAGQFADASLQTMYNALVAAGSVSSVEALKVGLEIEEVDIRDLRALKLTTDNADLLMVYDSLEKGSRNHLRSFHSNLLKQGGTYTPKYITQAEYDAIANSPQEKG